MVSYKAFAVCLWKVAITLVSQTYNLVFNRMLLSIEWFEYQLLIDCAPCLQVSIAVFSAGNHFHNVPSTSILKLLHSASTLTAECAANCLIHQTNLSFFKGKMQKCLLYFKIYRWHLGLARHELATWNTLFRTFIQGHTWSIPQISCLC